MSSDRLAFDRASVRAVDADGRMHVAISNISMAAVNEYLGSEIPEAESLGLDPNKRYALLRDPAELAKGAPSFNNLPILSQHVPVSAADHRPELVVGSTGTDAAFVTPYLQNSLVFWADTAIGGIESGEQRELSSAYRYRAVMEPGEYEGVKFDGRMVDLIGNHVAVVPVGRAGPTVIVGDSAIPPTEKDKPMPKHPASAMTHKAGLLVSGAIRAYLKPKLAQDAKIDLTPALKGVTAKNWKAGKPALVKALGTATKGKLAADADIADVVELLDQLDDAVEEVAETDPIPAAADDDTTDPALDDDTMAKVKAILGPDADDEKCKALCALMKPTAAMDEPKTPVPGEKKPGDKPDTITKGAMDSAIAKAAKDATASALRTAGEIRDAERAVRPYVGELAMSFDSAEGVYRAAFEMLGEDVAGVHPSAFPHLMKRIPQPGAKPAHKPALAHDAAAAADYAKRFPNSNRLAN